MRYIITILLLIASIYTQAQISYWARSKSYTPPGTCKQYVMTRLAFGIIDTKFEYTNCETGVIETGYLMDADEGGPTQMTICSTTTPIRYSLASPPLPIDGLISMEEKGNCGDPIDPGESYWTLRIDITASNKAAGGTGYGYGWITRLKIMSTFGSGGTSFGITPGQDRPVTISVPNSWGTVSIVVGMGGYNLWWGRRAALSIDNPLSFVGQVGIRGDEYSYQTLTDNVTALNSDYYVTGRKYLLLIHLN